jgi:rhodanese-related sulfurtransferase
MIATEPGSALEVDPLLLIACIGASQPLRRFPFLESLAAMTVVDLDRDTVKRGLADGSMLLIDVREDYEFARGHIPGSVSFPLSTFDPDALKALVEADGRRPVFSCASGVRSVNALAAAQGAGLDITEHYAGAFKDWYAAGEPVEA